MGWVKLLNSVFSVNLFLRTLKRMMGILNDKQCVIPEKKWLCHQRFF
jgi:hypothetical protein